MRLGGSTFCVVAMALGTVAPSSAQMSSLADRVMALEQRASDPQVNIDLINQINDLRSQIRQMQGSIEEMQHGYEQLKQQSKDQYLDLDSRLKPIESGSVREPSRVPANPISQVSPSHSNQPPNVHGDASALTISNEERIAYNVAFDALKNSKYADAAELFISFLQLYPNGVYTPNAIYWLGESYYAMHDFVSAEAQFRSLLSRYPTHDKASGSLLKEALCQANQGKNDDAQHSLEQVLSQYPGTDAARLAQERLQSMKLSQAMR
ncbi:tol-pal system protein YbgF [Xylella fastidiosa subsp. multiplex]|uniref:tol-pal system protein YbgF n=1 Tax=Xylella fastidiosa TaxID=2371 RepID=UPI00235E567B|nr:tol-pal system protein YbgF [Xylella fastidiosa]MDD0927639.1 tol-pal system protein YbgF [Xylella fastidiosa subsp. multiplex]